MEAVAVAAAPVQSNVLWAVLCAAVAVSMLRAHMLAGTPRGPHLCDPPPRGRECEVRGSGGAERRSSRMAVSKEPASTAEEKPTVLLLIAHPDDEAMFFVPSILAIAKASAFVRIFSRTSAYTHKHAHARHTRNTSNTTHTHTHTHHIHIHIHT